ncbi:MAG: type I-A CRISPR-associated protein Csa5 [Candidatus Korarchaeota archaeon]|nr:type I-A CRISPR-associated protein Csa5 [Candidatus Korarchaeota archaeon]
MDSIAELLAVLIAENEEYTFVDKLGYAPSKDLVLYYLREALRDYHSLLNQGFKNSKAKERADSIELDKIEKGIEEIGGIQGSKELREKISLMTAKALAIAASLRGRDENG